MSKLLSTLALEKQISYPCVINHQDRPDFILEMGRTKTGIEVTEAVTRDYLHVQSMKSGLEAGHAMEMSNFRCHAELDRKRKKALAKGPAIAGPGWAHGQKEEEFIQGIALAADKKQEKLRIALPKLDKCDKYVLAIYNNLPPVIDNAEEEILLRNLLDSGWSVSPFDEIFVLSGQSVFQMKAAGSLASYKMCDLWGKQES